VELYAHPIHSNQPSCTCRLCSCRTADRQAFSRCGHLRRNALRNKDGSSVAESGLALTISLDLDCTAKRRLRARIRASIVPAARFCKMDHVGRRCVANVWSWWKADAEAQSGLRYRVPTHSSHTLAGLMSAKPRLKASRSARDRFIVIHTAASRMVRTSSSVSGNPFSAS